MTSLITCSIDYHSDSVLCFDPQKVLTKLLAAFPAVEADRNDLSAQEVAWVSEYTDSAANMPDEQKEMMRRQILGKQTRNGPVYRFIYSDSITGQVQRYSVVFKTDGCFGNEDAEAIREFMSTLEAGVIRDGST